MLYTRDCLRLVCSFYPYIGLTRLNASLASANGGKVGYVLFAKVSLCFDVV